MTFLNRIFNRKGKTELASSVAQPLRRSLTDPAPSGSLTPSKGRKSSSDDREGLDGPAPSRLGGPRARRGCDLGRSRTAADASELTSRDSHSSSLEPASMSDDGGKSNYRQMKAVHRSRLHTIMAAQDRTTKRNVILKVFPKARMSSTVRTKLESEVHHLRTLTGLPGVVQYITHFEDDESVYVVLERVGGATLIELVANSGGRLSESVLAADVLIPLLQLLADLHRRGVVHRHIKPEHVLCSTDRGQVTVVDWSEAVNMKQRCLNNRAGTLEYMAPEVVVKPTAEEVFHHVLYNGMSEEELPQYDEKADVWSVGVLAYEAITGCQPFLADTAADMAQAHTQQLEADPATGQPRLFAGRAFSPEARAFLVAALQLDPINRASADKLLQTPFLQKHWAAYQAKQVALMASIAASMPASPPHVPASASGVMAAVQSAVHEVNQAAAMAMTAARMGLGAATSGGGNGCTSIPLSAGPAKPNLLVAAPIQFPVR
ncbi:hypothetical protein HYH03_017630 [Edaphochlamys debaryana]|uniref:Protein kinase domain-containing protein n=1 Tax=Edaphochlamys debaryana TaxID=47281 RepID=A0A836BQE6_9CHLO|nr:hypothetical protein HYH03_017630 [Edaphochlamys debaryana]|eukprot:KAG2483523.1 hypothetical protein HYH03_017630 [Edaphochlamys debaryana]